MTAAKERDILSTKDNLKRALTGPDKQPMAFLQGNMAHRRDLPYHGVGPFIGFLVPNGGESFDEHRPRQG